ncbi:glycosyltransferase family 2 protein [Oricola indica]|uniref:glycosyltransferase family 2 protein n=1 Tax=Oricola indica TaxID=2872591 RepID=UPI003CCBB825
MKLSFVIPAFNEQDFIGPCLESVMRELAAVECEAEVIVVNNASTDDTRERALAVPGVKVVDEPRKGIVRARQAGYVAARGELIANIDSDTRLPEGWIKTVLREFERDPDLAALSGPLIYYDMSRIGRLMVRSFYAVGYLVYLVMHHVLHAGAMIQGGNFIVRRDVLDKIGGYDTTIEFYGEDTDVARRVSREGRVKWTFRLPIYSSARRMKGEGLVTVGLRYAINYVWVAVRGRPFTKDYKDIRPE